jgi:hypothetical protein
MNKKQIKHEMLLDFMMHSRTKKPKRKPALMNLVQKLVVLVLP